MSDSNSTSTSSSTNGNNSYTVTDSGTNSQASGTTSLFTDCSLPAALHRAIIIVAVSILMVVATTIPTRMLLLCLS